MTVKGVLGDVTDEELALASVIHSAREVQNLSVGPCGPLLGH